jgi:hypothetical protein
MVAVVSALFLSTAGKMEELLELQAMFWLSQELVRNLLETGRKNGDFRSKVGLSQVHLQAAGLSIFSDSSPSIILQTFSQ